MMRVLVMAVVAFGLAGCGSSKLIDKDLQPAELGKIEVKQSLSVESRIRLGCSDLGYLSQMQPVIEDDKLYVACGTEVSVLDAQTLSLIATTSLANEASSGVVKVGDDLYVGSLNGFVYRLNAETLKIKNKFQFESEVVALSVGEGVVAVRTQEGKLSILESETLVQKWAYTRQTPELSMRGMSAALISGNKVFLGLDQGRMVAFELDTGRTLWERVIGMPTGVSELERLVDIDANLHINERSIVVVTYQGRIAEVDAQTGGVRWYKPESSLSSPAMGQHLYVVDEASSVKAYHVKTGNIAWDQSALRYRQLTAPVFWNNAVWAADFEGVLHGFDQENGRLMARNKLSDVLAMPLVVKGQSMYAMTVDGTLSRLSVNK